jgi:hypothetical protein
MMLSFLRRRPAALLLISLIVIVGVSVPTWCGAVGLWGL